MPSGQAVPAEGPSPPRGPEESAALHLEALDADRWGPGSEAVRF